MLSEDDFFERNSSVPPNLTPGMRLGGKYELTRRIGSGAMGEVWAAQHVSLQEEVAIKIVLRDIVHPDGTSTESRFLLEARIAAQLSRKTRHIVNVTDHGEDGPYAYLVMELLNGESLEDRLERTGPMPLSKVIPIVYQIARALSVAHADGVLHRDLKPTNVYVTVDEEGRAVIKILDFGIAKLRGSMRRIPIASPASKHTTLRGFLLGTPTYMSPEQAKAKKIDHRTDVWALAVIAYHLLTKQFPFDGETPELLIANLCHGEPTPIQHFRPDLPLVVGDLFARAFSERIDERFQSAVAFAGALEHLETLARRLGGVPQPMNAITIPPPARARQGGTERLVVASSPPSPHPLIAGATELPSGPPAPPAVEITGAPAVEATPSARNEATPSARNEATPSARNEALPSARKDAAPSARTDAPAEQEARESSEKKKHESTIIAAGVPRKRSGSRLAGLAAAATILLLAFGAVAIHLENDPGSTGIAAGAATYEAKPSVSERDQIPSVEPAVDDHTPSSATTVTSAIETRPRHPPAAALAKTPASRPPRTAAPPPPVSPAEEAPPAALTPPPPRYDRSEVF